MLAVVVETVIMEHLPLADKAVMAHMVVVMVEHQATWADPDQAVVVVALLFYIIMVK